MLFCAYIRLQASTFTVDFFFKALAAYFSILRSPLLFNCLSNMKVFRDIQAMGSFVGTAKRRKEEGAFLVKILSFLYLLSSQTEVIVKPVARRFISR